MAAIPLTEKAAMPTHGEFLRAAFDSRDIERLVALLDERVIWRGLPTDDDEHDAADAHPDDATDHTITTACRCAPIATRSAGSSSGSWPEAGRVIRSCSPRPATQW